jgi:lysophospholipase L1-like esterase
VNLPATGQTGVAPAATTTGTHASGDSTGVAPGAHASDDTTDMGLGPLPLSPAPAAPPRHPLLGKAPRALAVMLLLLAIPYASPHLRQFRIVTAPWDRTSPEGATAEADETQAAPAPTPAPSEGEVVIGATENRGSVTNALPTAAAPAVDVAELARLSGSVAIEDPTGHALDAFFASLSKTEAREEGAVTRVLHYGDSIITSDLVSGTLRRKFQARFGDAGHGFILIANPWEWYFHNDVVHTASEGWSVKRIVGPLARDGLYGLGGVSFHAESAASAYFATTDKGDFGTKVSRFDVYYLEQPGGGDVMLTVPGKPAERLSTRGPKRVSRVHSVAVPDGRAWLSLKTWGNGDTRLFGVAMERDVPGVAYDALGANGARARLLSGMNGEHWREQMALRKPALVILQYGTNESEDPWSSSHAEAEYKKHLGALLEKVIAAADGASVLVASPLDRAEREDGKLRTKPAVKKIVSAQREVALAHGCAFWSTFDAMGGEGAMARWVKTKPPLGSGDYTHPTPAGADLVGDLFFKALMASFEAYRVRLPTPP